MSLAPADLLPGETVLGDKNANMLIRPQDHGLAPVFSSAEAIGGKLYLTTARLVFRAHALNRVTGTTSLFLANVEGVRDTSRGLMRKIEVTTGRHATEFVLWGIPAFMEAIAQARSAITPEARERLRELVLAGHPALHLGLRASATVDATVRAVMAGAKLVDLVAAPTPAALATVGEAIDLVKRG